VRLSQKCLAFALCCFSRALALSIEGHVVNSETNQLVPQADLVLTCLTNTKRSPCKDSSGKASGEGAFQFSFRDDGTYRLQASAAGLVATRSSQIEVTFNSRYSASDLKDVTLKLAPESTVTGKVLDESGQPKPGTSVEALRISAGGDLKSVSKAVTNQEGVYLLRSLMAGNYYVATALQHEDKNDAVHAYLYYAPNAMGLDQASVTHIETGQNYSDVEIHLRPVVYFKLQGRAQMDTANSVASDKPQLHLAARDGSGVTLPAREILLNPDGNFQTEVLPGAYTLLLTGAQSTSQPGNPQKPQKPLTLVHLLAKQDIEVTAKDLLGIALLIPPPITVTGHAVLESTTETKVANGVINLRPAEAFASGLTQMAHFNPDGSFTVTDCDPAKYLVRVFPPAGTYVKSIVFNQQDITTELLDLSKGSGGDLTVTIRPGAATLTGTVSSSESQTLFDVALIPDSWLPNGLTPVRHAATKDGRFTFSNVHPGRYTAVATTGVDNKFWEMAPFLREIAAHGVPVDLVENDQKQINVPYVTFAEIDILRSRLGLD